MRQTKVRLLLTLERRGKKRSKKLRKIQPKINSLLFAVFLLTKVRGARQRLDESGN
jgi:hypothetical protein